MRARTPSRPRGSEQAPTARTGARGLRPRAFAREAGDPKQGTGPKGLSPLGPTCGADDHVQLARSGTTRQRIRRHAELLRQTKRERVAAWWEVHGRLRIGEAARAVDLLDRVAERLHVARHPTRVVVIAAPVENRHVHAPGRRQNRPGLAGSARAASPWDEREG